MSRPSPKLAIAIAAAVGAHLALFAVLAPAQAAESHYYLVTFEQPVGEQVLVADGLAWRCEGTQCIAPKSNSRPLKVCARLARKHGRIEAFSSAKGALDAEELARCNRD